MSFLPLKRSFLPLFDLFLAEFVGFLVQSYPQFGPKMAKKRCFDPFLKHPQNHLFPESVDNQECIYPELVQKVVNRPLFMHPDSVNRT